MVNRELPRMLVVLFSLVLYTNLKIGQPKKLFPEDDKCPQRFRCSSTSSLIVDDSDVSQRPKMILLLFWFGP